MAATTEAKFEASEVARWASIVDRDALTADDLYAFEEASAELRAEEANERYFEDRAPTLFFGAI